MIGQRQGTVTQERVQMELRTQKESTGQRAPLRAGLGIRKREVTGLESGPGQTLLTPTLQLK